MAQYQLEKMFLSKSAKGRPGVKITPKALVIHWTANTNKGADAVANRNYFNDSGEAVSTHYIVDDHRVVQCLPEDEMAYHVEAKEYRPLALKLLSSYPNNCTIGIEMCVNRDGDFNKTYKHTVALVADILDRYSWKTTMLWRHDDVTERHCPGFFVSDSTAVMYGFKSAVDGWKKFKEDVLRGGSDVGKFVDMEGHWAKSVVERAYELGLVSGRTENKFAPNDKLTRAEGVLLLMRLYDLFKKDK